MKPISRPAAEGWVVHHARRGTLPEGHFPPDLVAELVARHREEVAAVRAASSAAEIALGEGPHGMDPILLEFAGDVLTVMRTFEHVPAVVEACAELLADLAEAMPGICVPTTTTRT